MLGKSKGFQMAWYDTGTVNVTNGSTTVVGVGTNFIAGAQVGEGFYGPDNRLYEIQAIVSATSLTLADVYLGTTQTGQGYKIVPTQSLVAALATQVSTLISDFQGVVDEAGSGKFNDGTAASAGITFTLDQDTGIFRPAANQIGFTTAGVQRAKISSTGLDVTGAVTAGDIDITGPTPTLRLTDDDVANEYTKIYNNSGNVFIDSRNGTSDGQFIVRGEGGGVITEHFRANANGVGIGTSSPSATLDVVGTTELNGDLSVSSATPVINILETDTGNQHRILGTGGSLYIQAQDSDGTSDGDMHLTGYLNADLNLLNIKAVTTAMSGNLTVDTSTLHVDSTNNRVGVGTNSPTERLDVANGVARFSNNIAPAVENDGAAYFGKIGGIAAVSASTGVAFRQTGTELARFNSTGLGIGTINPSHKIHVPSGNIFAGNPVTSFPANTSSGSGAGVLSAGVFCAVRDDFSLALGRHTTTGNVANFYYSTAYVGNIAVTGSTTSYNTSSDYRLKENIEPVQGAADIVKAMQPVTYTFKSDGSWHDGFLAHELQELHPRAVIGEKDAMKDEEYEVTPAVYEDVVIPAVEAVAEVPAVYDEEGVLVSEMVPAVEAQPERTEQQLVSEAVMGTRSVPDYQGVDYSKLTPILTAALQEALNKIDALEARLTALESA